MGVIGALAAGLLFGLGLILSGMADPAKVLNFLDVAGSWDPSLAFVMAGAIAVAAPGFWLAQKRSAPLASARFHVSSPHAPIDSKLLAGAAVFGIGWGLAGFCPGPALVSLPLAAPGRGSKWGNPFPFAHQVYLGKAWACEAYAQWLTSTLKGMALLREHLHELRGKNLACWCKPGDPCHADLLLALANEDAGAEAPQPAAGAERRGAKENAAAPPS